MKVALLIWNGRNRALLAELLAQENCEIVGAQDDYFDSDVDMYIVDGPALATVRERLAEAKAAAEPLFLPILLIGPRPETMQSATRPWRVIDDVVLRPILKRELQARIRTLLHARGLSLRLRDSVALY
ncbi:MAG TPA: hypothetical protein VFH72_11715, partial [Candidatus Baltobacteraceae bacterium]|nr:hypothetical protein [Candidatus Baltobacteraceae bacterium]